jgi:calcineurin-like phosphoesterase
MPSRYEPATGNPRLNGLIVEADAKTGRAVAVTRVSYAERDLFALSSPVLQ